MSRSNAVCNGTRLHVSTEECVRKTADIRVQSPLMRAFSGIAVFALATELARARGGVLTKLMYCDMARSVRIDCREPVPKPGRVIVQYENRDQDVHKST